MSRIDAVLLILLMCVISTGVLIVLRWALKWSPARRFINAGIGSIIVFMALMFLVFTFGKNSYDSAFNKAFAQYFNVPTEDKRIVLEQERKRKVKDETFESIAAGMALVICTLATYLTRTKRPKIGS
ncbi:MAG: hypothetical protein WCP12_10055 [bacterium]